MRWALSIVLVAWTMLSQAQATIPLATKVGEWSSDLSHALTSVDGGLVIRLRSKVVSFDLTSGEIEVLIVNESPTEIDLHCGIKPTTGGSYDNIMNIEDAHRHSGLSPGDSVVFNMSLTGCVLKNPRKMKVMERVQNCRPRLLFISGWVQE